MKKVILFVAAFAMTIAATAGNIAFVQLDNQSATELAAQTFFTSSVSNGEVITPADLADLDVTATPAVWVMIDRQDLVAGEANLPVSSDFKAALEAYVKRGGNVILTNHATQLVNSIGRCTYAPGIFGSGAGVYNGDVWGVQAVIGNVEGQIYDHREHEIYNNMESNDAYGHPTFAFIGAGNKLDRNCMWDLNSYGFTPDPNVVRTFENQTNSIVLGTWQHVIDYCCAGIVEFLPTGEFTGTVLAIGLASFDWQAPKETSNMELLVTNMAAYMSKSVPAGIKNVVNHRATKVIENGRVVILMDGARYNVLGATL